MKRDYDLVVIGGGSAGYGAASTGIEQGLKVAVIEGAETLGGLCVQRGCMPSKTIIETANRMRDLREGSQFGIEVPEGARVDMDELQKRRRRMVSKFQGEREEQLKTEEFDLIRGRAQFVDSHHLKITDGESEKRLSFRTAVIATGSSPRIPDIEGLSEVTFWLSRDALEAEELPEHLLVVGGGVIACELGCCFEGLGSRVTIINRSDTLLEKLPPEASQEIEQACERKGIELKLEAETKSVKQEDGEFIVTIERGEQTEELRGSHLLIATGRTPQIDSLNLEAAQIDSDEKGISTNENCQTSQSHIFAVGDCADGIDIVHHAVIEGEQAARNARAIIDHKAQEPADKTPTVFAIFSDPEIIHIGPPQSELVDRDDLEERTLDLSNFGKAIIRGLDEGLLKVTFEKESGKLIAATGVGRGVIDFSHSMVFAIRQEMTLEEMLKVPHYHPTLAESWTYLEK
ncbi:dihydrolipoyl dehydrogenase family protein [Roseibacillus persicicus]|uniref:dihydrolipoyl dehydrogenase family protein n=1 Tax=Roseibacillus persicicus TaxID=454148 RepID=UPI00280D754A|nr:NAD(P)/FAD-dependent oxidoreductase [Roseibacillus persicicus]MDQ8190050.1 NAD(P)/FAD-dependent oxidoreductase [Roseibacillus persicicus]